jgi:hypothetical protein
MSPASGFRRADGPRVLPLALGADSRDGLPLGAARPPGSTVVGFRGISNFQPALSSGGSGMCPVTEKAPMSSELKRLVDELDLWLAARGDLLDAPARDEFRASVERLKQAVEVAEVEAEDRLMIEAMNLLASALSVLTNVMALWK